jgi:hypothetical protein
MKFCAKSHLAFSQKSAIIIIVKRGSHPTMGLPREISVVSESELQS